MYGEKCYQLHAAQRKLLPPLNNLENRSFRNRENLFYKKTADSVLLSLFMRTNGKCNKSHAPSALFCFTSGPNIPEGPEYEKISTVKNGDVRCKGRSFTKLQAAIRQLLRPPGFVVTYLTFKANSNVVLQLIFIKQTHHHHSFYFIL